MRKALIISLLALVLCLPLRAQEPADSLGFEMMRPLVFTTFIGAKASEPAIQAPAPLTFSQMAGSAAWRPVLPAMPFMQQYQRLRTAAELVRYKYMMADPARIKYLSWTLPELPEITQTRQDPREFMIADIPADMNISAPEMIEDIKRINWLHNFDGGVQFSQAYLSPNWYQGGTNSLSLLLNLLWEVSLNEVYHPKVLFTNSISYKLGLYSTPQDTYHNYGISQDLFQWNLKAGLRASHNWFYSVAVLFKTQFLRNYGENSLERKASFLSPGEFNLGLGMTYNTKSKNGRLKFGASIAPLSYNLKTCIDHSVDPALFSMPAGKRVQHQFGSNSELTADWTITDNISWRSRLFLFTNYKDFQGDWENTFNFSINKFLSTQIYLHMRYDTAATAVSDHWRYWMIKEILSFGFRYAFSTK